MVNPHKLAKKIAAKKTTKAAREGAAARAASAAKVRARASATHRTIKGADIRAGMILLIYGGDEKINVQRVTKNPHGAVILYGDNGKIRGVSKTETVKHIGEFNP